jgi:TNF receptor-associated protein 1
MDRRTTKLVYNVPYLILNHAVQIVEDANAKPGCQIELRLKGEAERFAEEALIREIIEKYSYFVTVPIFLNGEHVNKSVRAIWTLDAQEVTRDMHDRFFRQLAKTHHPHLMSDRPRYILQYKVGLLLFSCNFGVDL